ncbi:chemotaxis protein CheW [Pseudacidovorax intermedius]|uniref:Chemotaxis protein CheW n=1 Tax=Pseudacidovorax intermedius TaxID=433924 RepID=A0A147GLB4_9BURK|nr:chemotaxis protein CheW [Pseudacidovorax intermedius]KTT12767.1 chemotaxis protein CheW [Pseudacidovorax intermedius]
MNATASSASTSALPATAAAEPSQYLTFQLAGEMFAIGILSIKEIIEYGELTTVPMMPPSVRGVINLRGAVVPVIDLQARFGREPAPVGKRTCIVIVEVRTEEDERQVLGIVVDAVSEVLDIAATDIEPAPAFGARIRADFIQGMGKVRGRFVILLDLEHVLAGDELAELGELSTPAAQSAMQAPAH